MGNVQKNIEKQKNLDNDLDNDSMFEFICFIDTLMTEELESKVECIKGENYFLERGCYALARIIKHFIPKCKIWSCYEGSCVCIEYQDHYYNSMGRYDQLKDLNSFKWTDITESYKNEDVDHNDSDILLYDEELGYRVPVSEWFIRYIPKCRIDELIERVNKPSESKMKIKTFTNS